MVRIFRLFIALTMNPGAEIRKFDKGVIFFVLIERLDSLVQIQF